MKKLELLARVTELTHNATLVHDDVIDLSHKRRNKPTVNEIYGNKKAVIMGDYMLARRI